MKKGRAVIEVCAGSYEFGLDRKPVHVGEERQSMLGNPPLIVVQLKQETIPSPDYDGIWETTQPT